MVNFQKILSRRERTIIDHPSLYDFHWRNHQSLTVAVIGTGVITTLEGPTRIILMGSQILVKQKLTLVKGGAKK